MKNDDPPLKCLTAFDATVRLESMTAAARELGTSQPAISQRIRQLEDALGLPLFDRTQRRPRLTADGRSYHEEIAGALRRIHGATRRLRARASARSRELSIAVHFGFAHLWLLPRLPRLEAATHGLEEELDSDAIARLPLLHMDDRDPRWLDWPRWCALAGLSTPPRPARFHYNNYPLLLNAAIEGNGLALGWHGLIGPLLEEGTLVALSPAIERTGQGYLLGTPHEDSAVIAPIVDWFVRECGFAA